MRITRRLLLALDCAQVILAVSFGAGVFFGMLILNTSYIDWGSFLFAWTWLIIIVTGLGGVYGYLNAVKIDSVIFVSPKRWAEYFYIAVFVLLTVVNSIMFLLWNWSLNWVSKS